MLTPTKATNGALPTPPPSPRPRANRPNSEQAGLNLISVWSSIRRVWPTGLLLGLLLGPVFAGIGWLALAPKHSATAFLQVEMDQTPLAFKTADQASGGILAFKVYKNTQKQLVTSPKVLATALLDESVRQLESVRTAKDPLQWLSEDLKITFPDDGEVMAIELSSMSVADSKAIVDAVVDSYMKEIVSGEQSEKNVRLATLEKSYSDSLNKVRDKRQEIRTTADRLGTGDSGALTIAQQAAIQRYGQLQLDFSKVNYELLEAEDRLQQMQTQLDEDTDLAAKQQEEEKPTELPTGEDLESQISQLEIEQALARDLEYQQLTNDARELNRKLRDMERAGFGDRFTASLAAESEKIKKAMSSRREVVSELVAKDLELRKTSGRLNPRESGKLGTLQIDARSIKMQELNVGLLKKRKDLIEADLRKSEEETKNLGRSSAELEVMKSELSSLEDILARVKSELEATRIEQSASMDRVRSISKAAAIEGIDPKKRIAATAAGGLFGLFMPLCALVFLDTRKRHLDDPEKIKNELNVEILGMMPNSKAPVHLLESGDSSRGRHRYANVVESVHSVVAMLVKKASIDERQIFMVSSAGPSEGKSTLAQNLWAGLCEANYRCISVDMDFRRPSIHRYLNIEIGLGVSDVLTKKTDLGAATRSIDGKGDIITAGSSRQLNLAALANDTLPSFFDQLRGVYDFVIVDTAPILPVVDSRVIGEHVDGAVLSTIRDRSRVPQLIAAIELLKAHDTDIAGVVVNGFDSATYGYSYYGGY